jgi:hypothetical protein
MKAMALDPNNPFTLNNLGFAKEKEGELEQAVRYYQSAAATNSEEPVVVTIKKNWRGRPISRVAADNAKAARKLLDQSEDVDAKLARLNLRGVSALNRNDRKLARQYFQQAYKIDPANAFTLNNMGYVAELDGDRETADWFYSKAQSGDRSGRRVAVATRRDAEGASVASVAVTNDQTVAQAQQAAVEAKRRIGGEPALMRRDNTKVVEEGTGPISKTPRRGDSSEVAIPAQPVTASPSTDQNPPQPDQAQPVPEGTVPPQNPESAQPQTVPPQPHTELAPNQQTQQPQSAPQAVPPNQSAPDTTQNPK